MTGTHALGSVQYIDSIPIQCPSAGSVYTANSSDAESACDKFAQATQSAINRGPGKTCALAMCDSPDLNPQLLGSPTARSHVCLGFTIGVQLSWAQQLAGVLSMASCKSERLLNGAVSVGIPVLIISLEVLVHIVPIMLFRAPLLILSDDAEHALSELHYIWARSLLGCTHGLAGGCASAKHAFCFPPYTIQRCQDLTKTR